MTKLCKDCAHYIYTPSRMWGPQTHEHGCLAAIDHVTGETENRSAHAMRSRVYAHSPCGPEGTLFKQKENVTPFSAPPPQRMEG